MTTAVQNSTSGLPLGQRRHYFASLFLLFLAAVVYLTNLDGAPLRVNAEERNAEVVRTMVHTDDYMLPRLDNEIRLNKPPLLYWSATGAAELTGGFSLTALRLPSAFTAVGVVFLLLLWGRLLGAREEALIAGALLSVCYLFVQQARFGSYEMLLTLFSVASLYFVARTVRTPSWKEGAAAAAAFCLALMSKGTPAAATALLPAALWVIGMKRGRWLLRWPVLLLFVLAVLGGIAWYVYIFALRPESRKLIEAVVLLPFGVQVQEGSGARHHEPPWFFLKKIWDEAFPASFLLPLAAFHVWKERFFPAESLWRLITLCFLVPFVVFSAIPQKQDHYLLPLLPFLALLSAKSVMWGIQELAGRRTLFYRIPAWAVAAGIAGTGPVAGLGLWLVNDWNPVAAAATGALIGGAGVVAALNYLRARWITGFVSSAAGLALVWLVYFAAFLPVADNFGSGRIYFEPGYDATGWEAKFQSYPALRKLLDVERGLRHLDEVQEELLEFPGGSGVSAS